MKSTTLFAAFGLALGAITLLTPSTSQALPAFARQHATECSSCHTIYPQLNEFGEAFRKNSYVYPRASADGAAPAAAPRPAAPETGGAPRLLDRLVQAGIPSYVPISLDGTLNVTYNRQSADNNDLEIALRAIRLHGGGSLLDSIGYFLTYRLYSEGSFVGTGTTPANNVPDVEEAFAIWRQVLDSPLNIKAGRFEPGVSLWKKSNNLIVTNFAAQSYRAGTGNARSPFSLDAPENAIEVNSLIGSRVYLAAGLVDRKGQEDDDGYGQIAVKFGGTDFRGNEPEVDLQSDSIWDFLHITIGGFGYAGRNAKVDNNGIAGDKNEFYRVGGNVDAQYNRVNLRLTGTYGRDKDLGVFALTPVAKQEIKTYAFGSELQYFIKDNLVALMRYEQFDDNTALTKRYLPAIVYAPRHNVKTSLQYIYDDFSRTTEATKNNQIVLLSARLAF